MGSMYKGVGWHGTFGRQAIVQRTGEGAPGEANERLMGSHVSDPGEPGNWDVIQRTTSAIQDPKTEFWEESSENSMMAVLEQGPREKARKVTHHLPER